MWKSGINQFIPFATTALCVVGLDLLKGVGIGLLISIIYILRQNARISFSLRQEAAEEGETTIMVLAEEVSFLNKSSIKKTLHHLPNNTRLIVDAGKSQYIDFDVLEVIRDFAENGAYEKDISVTLVGFKNAYAVPQKH
jgi:MFS superfamily sulfate permease-like transporter